jgi:hypothetical protein
VGSPSAAASGCARTPAAQAGVVAPEHDAEQLGQRARGLDAGGPAAHDYEVELTPVDERGLGVDGLEPFEHVVAQADRVLERVQGRGVVRGPGHAEPGGHGAHGHHQVIEGHLEVVGQPHRPPVPVDADDLPPAHVQVALAVEQAADGMGHVGGVQAGGRHLVQQRLERGVVLPVDQGDLDGRVVEPPGDGQPAEPRPHDDDVRSDSHAPHLPGVEQTIS